MVQGYESGKGDQLVVLQDSDLAKKSNKVETKSQVKLEVIAN